jgi:hypothetical protein
MKKVKSVPISEDIAEDMAERLLGVRATVECIAASIQDEVGIVGTAAEALQGVRLELERIYCDLGVSSWSEFETKELSA